MPLYFWLLREHGLALFWKGDQIGPPEGKKEQDRILVVVGASRCPERGLDETTRADLENIQMQTHMRQLFQLLIQRDLREGKGDDDALNGGDTVESLALVGTHGMN